MHEHHAHLLLSGSHHSVEQLLGLKMQPFPEFLAENPTEHPIRLLNQWIYRFLRPAFQQPHCLSLLIQAALETAAEQGVSILEASIGVNFPSQFHCSVENLLQEIANIHEKYTPGLELRLDLGISREFEPTLSMTWLKQFLAVIPTRPDLGKLLYGIDLYDVEDLRPPEVYKEIFQFARSTGLRLKAHVGEFGSAEMVRKTVEVLDLDEVQHGIHAAENPEVLEFLAKRGTILNLAPASNQILGTADFTRTPHPIRRIAEAGVPFTISTDDFLLFGKSIKEQCGSINE